MQLSALHRNSISAGINKKRFDLIIIGGGITGAGIALDAASRDMQVLLLEKYDFASGTSSKSTKLIHGGLRYLKQLEFALVRQVGMERGIIHQLAPHLVEPINMLLPIYKNGSLGRTTTSLALWVYDFLAKVKKQDAYRMLGKLQIQNFEPLLKTNGLIGGAVYKEYRTDDARLTIEILKTAAEYGATCLNYAKVENFLFEENKIAGVKLHDLITNTSHDVYAKKIINAAGPWVDEVRRSDNPPEEKTLHLTKGIHIVVNKTRLHVQHAVYFDVESDKRMIFVIPRNEIVYIGTTDTNYSGDKDDIAVTKEDVNYLLHAVNKMFPSVQLQKTDIISSWAGLRPLIHEHGKSPSELSRKDEIFISDRGLISIAGGKLTGYRKMAEKAVDLIADKFKRENDIDYPACKTSTIQLHGAGFEIPIEEYIERRAGEAKQIQINTDHINYLVKTYGTDTDKIIELAFEKYNVIQNPKKRILYAEILYSVQHEMTTNISDFAIRRTGKLYFQKEQLLDEYKLINDILSEIIPAYEADVQLKFFEHILASSTHFD
ncbi:MAG: glycerol-3-phosphate dehydrogenase/oxidase [Fimbriimonadaceae bacterium]|nr:glycerol-3-phosphate dehydrogenase/oxidase [Chitinophagales bacterium]